MAVDEDAFAGVRSVGAVRSLDKLAQADANLRPVVHEWIATLVAEATSVDDPAGPHDGQLAHIRVAVGRRPLADLVVGEPGANVQRQDEPGVEAAERRGIFDGCVLRHIRSPAPVGAEVAGGALLVPSLVAVSGSEVGPGVRARLVVDGPDGDRDGGRVGVGLRPADGIRRVAARDQRQRLGLSVGVDEAHGRVTTLGSGRVSRRAQPKGEEREHHHERH